MARRGFPCVGARPRVRLRRPSANCRDRARCASRGCIRDCLLQRDMPGALAQFRMASRACSISSWRRTMPTSVASGPASHAGFDRDSFAACARTLRAICLAACSTCATSNVRRPFPWRISAAYSPARFPKTRRSESEFPPRRFAPCKPAPHSPAANNPERRTSACRHPLEPRPSCSAWWGRFPWAAW